MIVTIFTTPPYHPKQKNIRYQPMLQPSHYSSKEDVLWIMKLLIYSYCRSKNPIFRQNVAERAIYAFKAYFIAILYGTGPKLSLNLWDKLLPHAAITLSLLRNSRVNPLLSAYFQVWSNFDFNKTSLPP